MLKSNINEKGLKNGNPEWVNVSIDDLDNQFEFYNKTLNEFEKLNHNNILKLNKLQNDINIIKKENETIKKENETIKKENETIKKENGNLKNDIKILREENEYYKLLLNTKVYKFPNFLRRLIDKTKLFFRKS